MLMGYAFEFLQVDGGTVEPRHFNNHPKCKGHVTFTPRDEPIFYLVGVDAEGYETSLGMYDNKPEALMAACSIWQDVGAAALYDMTTDPVTVSAFATAGAVASNGHIFVSQH